MGVYGDAYAAVRDRLNGQRDYLDDFDDDDSDDDFDYGDGDSEDDGGVDALQMIHDVAAQADGVFCAGDNLRGY
jgi:hypothetical protein